MAEVLLTHSNHLFADPKQVEKMQPYPPLQTLLAAAVLRGAGISVALFDPTFQPPFPAFGRALARHTPRYLVVCEDGFNFLSKMCLLHNRELAFRFAASARCAGLTPIVHGPDSSDHVRQYLDAGFDCVLTGEVESSLLQLIQTRTYSGIPGLAYFNSSAGAVTYTPPRAPRTDLDSLPLPAWDLLDLAPYRDAWLAAHGYFSLNIASSRGCPYRCNWCAKPIYGDTYHARSPQSVAAEMRELKIRFAPDHLWFADDIFALSARWTEAFAAEVERLDARVPFKMQSRCDLMTRPTAAALRRAGCAEVWMGAESGSQKILDAMDKGVRVEHIAEARGNLRRHGIRACFFLQFGYPGETWEDIELTVRMVRQTQPDDIGVSVSYPLPRTRFYNIVAAQLQEDPHWRDSGDLAMMFQGAYSTPFYRALADALHAEVRRTASPAVLARLWDRVHQLKTSLTPAEVA